MNRKAIRNHLDKKITEWIESIENETLREQVRENVIVTGGCITSLLNSEEPNDYDVYFKTKECVKAIAHYYVDKFNIHLDKKHHENKIGYQTRAAVFDGDDMEGSLNTVQTNGHEGYNWGSAMLQIPRDQIKIIIRSDGIAEESTNNIDNGVIEDADNLSEEVIEKSTKNKDPYRPVFLSPNAITLSDKIQLVIRFYGSVDEIHKNFDYVHCTNSYNHRLKEVNLRSEALAAIINKELVYSGSLYPICSIIRLRKFLKRGWHINAGQILKMSFQISNLNLADPVVLEDQLVGVDTMYFMTMIRMLKQEQENNDKFEVTNEYFLSVVDKVFDK